MVNVLHFCHIPSCLRRVATWTETVAVPEAVTLVFPIDFFHFHIKAIEIAIPSYPYNTQRCTFGGFVLPRLSLGGRRVFRTPSRVQCFPCIEKSGNRSTSISCDPLGPPFSRYNHHVRRKFLRARKRYDRENQGDGQIQYRICEN